MATNTLSPAEAERRAELRRLAEAIWASQDTDPLPDNFTELCEGEDLEPIWSTR
jgi:hypothetical protein